MKKKIAPIIMIIIGIAMATSINYLFPLWLELRPEEKRGVFANFVLAPFVVGFGFVFIGIAILLDRKRK